MKESRKAKEENREEKEESSEAKRRKQKRGKKENGKSIRADAKAVGRRGRKSITTHEPQKNANMK